MPVLAVTSATFGCATRRYCKASTIAASAVAAIALLSTDPRLFRTVCLDVCRGRRPSPATARFFLIRGTIGRLVMIGHGVILYRVPFRRYRRIEMPGSSNCLGLN